MAHSATELLFLTAMPKPLLVPLARRMVYPITAIQDTLMTDLALFIL